MNGNMSEPAVKRYVIYLCDLCISGAGGQCHVPGCALWLNRAPDFPLRPERHGMCEPLEDVITDAHEKLITASRTIVEGFEAGVFVRNIAGDGSRDWAIRLVPYLAALGTLVVAAGKGLEEGSFDAPAPAGSSR